jgi:hypothetical protein
MFFSINFLVLRGSDCGKLEFDREVSNKKLFLSEVKLEANG